MLHGIVEVCNTSQETVAQMNNSGRPKKGRMFLLMDKMLVRIKEDFKAALKNPYSVYIQQSIKSNNAAF